MSSLPSSHADLFRRVLSELSETDVDEATVSQFLTLLDQKFQQSNLQVTRVEHRLTAQENKANFAVTSKTNAQDWNNLKTQHPEIVAQWKAIAPRVALKAGGSRKLTGYDAYQLFKGHLPSVGDGVSTIPRP